MRVFLWKTTLSLLSDCSSSITGTESCPDGFVALSKTRDHFTQKARLRNFVAGTARRDFSGMSSF
jgi:hypothetical protein